MEAHFLKPGEGAKKHHFVLLEGRAASFGRVGQIMLSLFCREAQSQDTGEDGKALAKGNLAP